MTELQAALLLAAETVDIWRAPAVAILALVFVGCLWFAAEANQA